MHMDEGPLQWKMLTDQTDHETDHRFPLDLNT